MEPVSILIPARNERRTIGATLAALAAQDYTGPMHVVVCVNGDRESTADIVQAARRELRQRLAIDLVELDRGHKPTALNAADRLALAPGPRIYLDADTRLSPTAVRDLVAALAVPEPRVAAPRKVLAPGPGPVVRWCGNAWLRLPWVLGDIVGSGVVAVNAAGRARWGEFPDVIADDGYAAWQFAPGERTVVTTCTAAVRFPSGFLSMLRMQRRWVAGGQALAASPHRPPYGPAWPSRWRVRAMLTSPSILLAAMVTRVVRLLARLLVAAPKQASW